MRELKETGEEAEEEGYNCIFKLFTTERCRTHTNRFRVLGLTQPKLHSSWKSAAVYGESRKGVWS